MRKLSAQPLDEAIARTYLRTFPSKQLFTNPRALPDIDSRHLFGDEQPMHLEVGCGTADYLRALARDDPCINFVGVDVAQKPLLQAVRMAAAQALPKGPVTTLQSLMRDVVTSGTGTALRSVPGGPVRAKTGTAEFGAQSPPQTRAWITGWQGDVAFTAFVEEGKSGGTVAGPVAARFLRALNR